MMWWNDPPSFNPPAPKQWFRPGKGGGAAGGGVRGRAGHEVAASERVYLAIPRLEEAQSAINEGMSARCAILRAPPALQADLWL